jgi:hypothetical protein
MKRKTIEDLIQEPAYKELVDLLREQTPEQISRLNRDELDNQLPTEESETTEWPNPEKSND